MRRTPSARPRRLARSLASVAALATVAVAAAGCGDDGDSDADAEETTTVTVDADSSPTDDGDQAGAPALAADQIPATLLQLENLGEGWVETEVSEDEEESPGCLGDVQDLDELGPTEKVEVAFGYGDDELPTLESGTVTFADESVLDAYFTDSLAALAGCTSVELTEDGATYALAITSDDAPTTDAIDDQINLHAEGTVTTAEGQEVPLSLHSSIYRIGANVSVTSTFTLAEAAGDLHATYTAIGVDRLAAVVAGEEPAVTTAPAPA